MAAPQIDINPNSSGAFSGAGKQGFIGVATSVLKGLGATAKKS